MHTCPRCLWENFCLKKRQEERPCPGVCLEFQHGLHCSASWGHPSPSILLWLYNIHDCHPGARDRPKPGTPKYHTQFPAYQSSAVYETCCWWAFNHPALYRSIAFLYPLSRNPCSATPPRTQSRGRTQRKEDKNTTAYNFFINILK